MEIETFFFDRLKFKNPSPSSPQQRVKGCSGGRILLFTE